MNEMIAKEDAGYAFDIVKATCAQARPGMPCTPQERERAMLTKRNRKYFLKPDPWIFLGLLPVARPWLLAIAGLSFSIIEPLPFILVFYLNRQLLDPLFPKKQSENVIGPLRVPGTGDGLRLRLISGRHS